MVSQEQRFTQARPCPVCGGYDQAPRGRAVRCYGFLSGDGAYAHCTRQERAGSLSLTEAGPGKARNYQSTHKAWQGKEHSDADYDCGC